MRNLKLLFILAVTLCVAAGCEKDIQKGGSLKIDAKAVNGNDYNDLIDEVRVVTTHVIYDVPSTEVVTCSYSNGGFALTLPKKIIDSAYTFVSKYGQIALTNDIYSNFFAYKNTQLSQVVFNLSFQGV